ncbi:MAG: ATP-binding cassette domain-containing protein, partial [Methylococcales bacterium]|nr:ATP-binding cassette domain-containing protein [Methylococcales bacterium]
MTLLYQLNNLQYDYGKNFTLSLPDLRILSQKITVLIGENGSGKSTLLNLLALQVFPTNGSLRFLDQPISKKQRLVFQKKIGFLPQKPYVFRGSVKDNLALALKFHHVPKKKQIEKITIILAHLKITHLGEQWAKSLSGGELQKVAIARVLITEP